MDKILETLDLDEYTSKNDKKDAELDQKIKEMNEAVADKTGPAELMPTEEGGKLDTYTLTVADIRKMLS